MSDQERVAFSCCLLCALPSLTHALHGAQKGHGPVCRKKYHLFPFFSSVWLLCVHVKVLACKTWFWRIAGLCRSQRSYNNIHLNQRRISRWWARAGARVVWSSPAWHYCKLHLCGLRRKRWLLSSLFLLVVQLFTISWGMESGLVWLLPHTCCCLKHSFSETNDFDVVVNELLMSALPLVWFMCFTAASS